MFFYLHSGVPHWRGSSTVCALRLPSVCLSLLCNDSGGLFSQRDDPLWSGVMLRAAAGALPRSALWRTALLLAAGAFLFLNLRYSSVLLAPAPPPRLYPPDPAFAPLALGQRPLPRAYGLNLLCWSGQLAPPGDAAEFRAAHAAWREAAALELQGTGAYLYPFEALHVTVSNPAPSTHAGHAGWGAEERALYARAWASALAARPCAPARAAFPLLLRAAPRLAPSGAAILLLDDPTGEVEGLRECMRRAAAALPPRVQALLGAAGFRAPARGHVHATLARLALPRAEGMGDAEVEERWARAARAWERLVAPHVEMLTVRGTALVQGSEAADLASPGFRDFVLWESSGGAAAAVAGAAEGA